MGHRGFGNYHKIWQLRPELQVFNFGASTCKTGSRSQANAAQLGPRATRRRLHHLPAPHGPGGLPRPWWPSPVILAMCVQHVYYKCSQYVYMYRYTCLYIHVNDIIYVFLCVYVYAHTHTGMYICTYTCVCVHIYLYIHTFVHICVYIYTHTYTHAHRLPGAGGSRSQVQCLQWLLGPYTDLNQYIFGCLKSPGTDPSDDRAVLH